MSNLRVRNVRIEATTEAIPLQFAVQVALLTATNGLSVLVTVGMDDKTYARIRVDPPEQSNLMEAQSLFTERLEHLIEKERAKHGKAKANGRRVE